MTKKKEDNVDVASAFSELESLAQWFEQGEPDLEAGIAKFERAMELSKSLKTRLTEAENKIKEIRLKNSDT